MRKIIMLASVAALAALPSAAFAKPPHGGNGHRAQAERGADGQRTRNRARPRADNTDRNRNGVADRLERRPARAQNQYGGAACPPGLARRSPACVPPGQARRMFRQGQRIPTNYGAFTSYNSIPLEYRDRYNIPSGHNYIYRDNSVYVVDRRTRLVRSIIDLLGR